MRFHYLTTFTHAFRDETTHIEEMGIPYFTKTNDPMEGRKKIPFVHEAETMITPRVKDEAENLAKIVAARILQETTCLFRHLESGEKATKPLVWDPGMLLLDSGYNDWKYWNGVVHHAFIQLTKHFKDQKYLMQVHKNYRFAFENLDFFRKAYELEAANAPYHQFFRMDRLDDFGAMSAALIESMEQDPDPRYDDYLERITDYILHRQDRLKDRTFCRRRFGITTLWSDDLYMSVPVLVNLYKLKRQQHFLDDAILQSELFHNHLYRPDNQLYHHCYYPDTGKHGVAHWSRANGWVMMARIKLMEQLPVAHPYYERLKELIHDQIIGLSRFQDHNGLWHQLLDKADSFPESSGTAMFTYGIARAVNQGWIPGYYSSIAIRGWEGLKHFVDEKGELTGVSLGFNIRQDLPFYYNQSFEPGGAHGVGALLLAALEVSKIKPYRDCVWC